MSEVSIIINGVRYDAVEIYNTTDTVCDICDILEFCEMDNHEKLRPFCCKLLGETQCFKESTKSFER